MLIDAVPVNKNYLKDKSTIGGEKICLSTNTNVSVVSLDLS